MTGATGFLGGALARRLVDDGHDVAALVRRPEAATDLRDLGVTLVPGDLDDTAALDRLLDGADGFFHVAGWFRFGRRERATLHAVNVEGTRNAMAAALRAEDPGARTVPYMLSGGTDAKAFSTLGIRCFGFAPLKLPADLNFSALFHGVDERVPVEGLQFGVRVLDRLLQAS